MPLSKKRMRERKRADRAKTALNRFDVDILPPIVKPDTMKVLLNGRLTEVIKPELDVDGNPIPDYTT